MATIDQEKRIKKEMNKLNKLFTEIEDNKKQSLKTLIQNIAFMTITLEDLQTDINTKGYIEEYKNGENQYGFKESTAIKIYNSLIKNYNTSLKQLLDQLPDEAKKSIQDDFDNFLIKK